MNAEINLLLLPGLMCDAAVWDQPRKMLGDISRVAIANYEGADSLEGMARQVLSAAPDKFCVAGHSMGGRIALEVARLEGKRVEKLALLDTGVHSRAKGERAQRQKLLDLAREHGMKGVAEAWAPPMVHPDRRGDAALMKSIFDMIGRTSVVEFERQVHALLTRPDASKYLPNISCEALVLCGREDGWAPVRQHMEIADKLPNASFVIIENCGHMAPMERPQEVGDALREWLL